MNYRKLFLGVACMAGMMSSCSDNKSYADLLTEESYAVNQFLVNQNVILDIPEDSVFEEGADAPYYRLDEDGNVYMQVINSGNKNMMAGEDELIYFRFERNSLQNYDPVTKTFSVESWGNSEDLSLGSASFRFGNYTLSSSSQWGTGLQLPLSFVGMESEVNLIIKSQSGMTSEIAQVIPFLYNVRYFKAGTNANTAVSAE